MTKSTETKKEWNESTRPGTAYQVFKQHAKNELNGHGEKPVYVEPVIPVNLNKKDLNKVMNIALKAHNLIGCRGVTRSDFKFYKGKFYLLETNTQPGMTSLSLVPEIAAYSGMSFINLIEWIIKDASVNR